MEQLFHPPPTPPTPPSDLTITAVDGYLSNAELWVDVNDTLSLDSGDLKLDSNTSASGKFTLPGEYKTHAVFVKAITGQSVDLTRGLVETDFVLAAPAGASVASPMTNMVVEQLAANPTMTQAEAEEVVIQSVTDSGLTASNDLIFGDYLAESSQQAQALNVIGEALVDNASLVVAKQLELAKGVANEAKNIIDIEGGSLDDFSPSIEISETQELTVSANTRPVQTDAEKP